VIEQILEGDRYLQVDQVDKARDIYQRVVELDPGNAIAVVGLARCALADGDDAKAYELASRALEIDPENDMARRMEARLSEILTLRGERVARPDAAATPAPAQMRPVVTDDSAVVDASPLGASVPDDPPAGAVPTAGAPTTTSPPPTPAAPVSATPAETSASATSTRPPPSPKKERLMPKSFLDRLLGR
jgi:tetratricopeptide (TPR) repeat protein